MTQKQYFKIFIITLSLHYQLFGIVANQGTIDIGGIKVAPDDVAKILIKSAESIEEAARKSRASKVQAIETLEQQLKDLGRQKDAEKIGASEFEQTQVVLLKKIDRLQRELEEHDKSATNVGNNIQSVIMNGWNTLLDNYREEQQRKTQIAIAAASKAVENEGRLAQTRLELDASMEKLRFMSNLENLKTYALFLALASLGITGGYYGVKLGYHYFEQLIEKKPALALKTSYQGWWDRTTESLYQFLGFTSTVPVLEENIVFAPELEEQLITIAKLTRIAHDRGLPHQSILLYGPPGTGKSYFAQLLATTCGMAYTLTSADRFAQFAEGKDVEEVHNLIDYAEKSPTGMIIFIDEIDALGADRNKLSQQWIRLQNAFLARTGTSSTKFKILGATNRLNALDPAFVSRFPHKINIPLPGLNERIRLLDLYIKKYIIDDRRTIKQNGNHVEVQLTLAQDITPEYRSAIAQKLNKASGRMIEQTIDEIRSLAYLEDDLTVTKKIFDAVVQRKQQELHALP